MEKTLEQLIMEKLQSKPEVGDKVGVIRLEMVREWDLSYGVKPLTTPDIAAAMMKPLLEKADKEMFVVMSLNTKLEPMAAEIVAIGTVNSCAVSTRETFKHAIINNAASIICFHNHPSGDAYPSPEDEVMTKRLESAGELLGIPLVDHIVIGRKAIYSFNEVGRVTCFNKKQILEDREVKYNV